MSECKWRVDCSGLRAAPLSLPRGAVVCKTSASDDQLPSLQWPPKERQFSRGLICRHRRALRTCRSRASSLIRGRLRRKSPSAARADARLVGRLYRHLPPKLGLILLHRTARNSLRRTGLPCYYCVYGLVPLELNWPLGRCQNCHKRNQIRRRNDGTVYGSQF